MRQETIKILESELARGKVERSQEIALRGGTGKCTIYKDLVPHPDPRVTESGKIVLDANARIGLHMHATDTETYTVLCGGVVINGIGYGPGEEVKCEKGNSHDCSNCCNSASVIRYVKRK